MSVTVARTLLLADDSRTIQQAVAIAFDGEAYEVRAVAEGQAALAEARARPPDVILADVDMPGLDGYELCRAIKSAPALRGIPVLLLTGARSAFDAARAAEAQADGHLAKPFDSQGLVDLVNGLLARASPEVHVAPPPPPKAVELLPELRPEPASAKPRSRSARPWLVGLIVVATLAAWAIVALLAAQSPGTLAAAACSKPGETLLLPRTWARTALLMKSFDPNRADALGLSPMATVLSAMTEAPSQAEWERLRQIADALIARGGRVDAPVYGGGYHALHVAVVAASERDVRYLLEQGADPEIRQERPAGKTPLELARDLSGRNSAVARRLAPIEALLTAAPKGGR